MTTEAWASSTAPRGMRKRGRRGCCLRSSGHAAAAACRSDRAAGERPLHCLRKKRACNRTERARERERAREQKGSLPPLPFFFLSRERALGFRRKMKPEVLGSFTCFLFLFLVSFLTCFARSDGSHHRPHALPTHLGRHSSSVLPHGANLRAQGEVMRGLAER